MTDPEQCWEQPALSPEAYVRLIKLRCRGYEPEPMGVGFGLASAMHELAHKYAPPGPHGRDAWHKIAQWTQALFQWIDQDMSRDEKAAKEQRGL